MTNSPPPNFIQTLDYILFKTLPDEYVLLVWIVKAQHGLKDALGPVFWVPAAVPVMDLSSGLGGCYVRCRRDSFATALPTTSVRTFALYYYEVVIESTEMLG